MKKHLVRIALGLVVVLVFVMNATQHFKIPLVERLELITYDTRLRLTMPRGIDNRIVIVDIDEASLAAQGRWPWRRDKLAQLLDQLFDHYHAAIVGFDVVFAEPDQSSGLGILHELAESDLRADAQFQRVLKDLTPRLEYDRLFAEKLADRPVVLGYYFSNVPGENGTGRQSGMLPAPTLARGTFTGKNVTPTSWVGYGANLALFQKAAASGGHFNPWPDEDGITRRVPMLAEHDGAYYESLSLAVIRLGLGSPPLIPGFVDQSQRNDTTEYRDLEWLGAGKIRIPVDDMVTALVPYRGGTGSFSYFSATDVLQGKVAADLLDHKIVLVGTTAPGLFDLRATPVDKAYPGVEIHANLIAGMLDGTIKQRPPYVLGAEVVLLLVSGIIMALVFPLITPMRATVITLIMLAALFATNVAVWNFGNLVLPLASGLLMIALLFALNMSYGFFVESRAKRQITGLFGQYVPPELVDEMSRDPDAFSMEGDSRDMSVLFTDVREFTTISEGLDPKDLSQLMNEFLTPLTRVIYRHRGTIDKYMGDCVMAFWGAPVPNPTHARSAVLAGVEMHKVLSVLVPQFKARNWPEIRIGVGINTGRMTVGNMGSEVRVAYTVMGDAVNLASRLEGLTRHYGVGTIVGAATQAQVKDVVFRELDRVKVKGKEEAVTIYEAVGLQSEVDQAVIDEISLWMQTLRLYRAAEWDMAHVQLVNLRKAYPARKLYSVFIDRIIEYRAAPPADGWDGSFTFGTK